MNTTNRLSISAGVSWLMQIKLRVVPIIASLLACLLLLLALSAQANPPLPIVILGTSINGVRDIEKQDLEATFNLTFSSLYQQYGLNFKVFNGQEALIDAFDQGKIDGIFGFGTDILLLEDQLSPRMAALAYDNGKYKFRYLLLVRKADNITGIEQLKGKRISNIRVQGTESLYLNTLLLRHKQAEPEQFFSQVVKIASSNIAINDLFFGRLDAAIVNENEYRTAIELNPQIAQNIVILDQSEPFILLAAGISKKVSKEMEDRTFSAAMNFQNTDAGRNAFKMGGLTGIRAVYPNDFDTLRALKNEYAQLKNANKLKPEPKPALHAKQKPAQGLEIATDKIQRTKKSGGLQ